MSTSHLKRAFIIGPTGQDGSYLADMLLEKTYYEVWGCARPRGQGRDISNLLPSTLEHIHWVEADINDGEALTSALTLARPDEIYNLAAMSYVPSSWPSVLTAMETNAIGAVRLFEAARRACPDARIYQASSSEMFGNVAPPQDEMTPMHPVSPYGVAKLAAHAMAHVYRLSYGQFIACGICFNHESPRRGTQFVSRKIAKRVAEIKMGLETTLELGDLTARRDWGYAPDYVEAMWMMLQHTAPEDFVIASGQSHSVREFMVAAFERIGISDWHNYVKTDESYVRPTEIRRLVGSTKKAQRVLGWLPSTDFQTLVRIMVDTELELLAR